MSPNPLPTEISPIPTQGLSFLQHRSLPLKGVPVAAPPTLHSLLLSQAAEAKKLEKSKRKAKQVSDASDVAAEAMRITRESMQKEELAHLRPNGELPKPTSHRQASSGGARLNKFVRRLHDMLQAEKDGGVIEWRKGLLVLHSTADFAKNILPKFFNTRNFKTFRRQLNYYGFVHVRSFSTAAASTTALWVNQELAESGSADIASVLTLKRVEPCELQKTAEGRRQRKEMAMHTVEEDLKIDPKTLQLEQIQSLARRGIQSANAPINHALIPSIPLEIAFPKSTCPPISTTRTTTTQRVDNVVSDDTQSRSSSTASSVDRHHHHHHSKETVEDSMGAANLLLLLSKAGC